MVIVMTETPTLCMLHRVCCTGELGYTYSTDIDTNTMHVVQKNLVIVMTETPTLCIHVVQWNLVNSNHRDTSTMYAVPGNLVILIILTETPIPCMLNMGTWF